MATVCTACNGLILGPNEPEHFDDRGEHWCACSQIDAAAQLEDDEPATLPPPFPPLGV